MIRSLAMAFVILALFTFGSAHACLINNDNNLIYDTVRDITWYSPSFTNMSWNQATSWAEDLTVGGATDWRLPTALNQDGSYPLYEYDVVGSELGHLYYESLGNVAHGPLTNKGPLLTFNPSTTGQVRLQNNLTATPLYSTSVTAVRAIPTRISSMASPLWRFIQGMSAFHKHRYPVLSCCLLQVLQVSP